MRNVKQEFCVTTLYSQCDLLGLSLSVALSVVCFQIKYVFVRVFSGTPLDFLIDLPIYIPDINEKMCFAQQENGPALSVTVRWQRQLQIVDSFMSR